MLAPWQPLLEWWFGWGTSPQDVADEKSTLWFGKHHDDEARERFGDLVEQALAGGLDEWLQSPQGWLGLVLLLDQLPRMIHRDTPRAFDGDRRAQVLVMQGLQKGWDFQLLPNHSVFFSSATAWAFAPQPNHHSNNGCQGASMGYSLW